LTPQSAKSVHEHPLSEAFPSARLILRGYPRGLKYSILHSPPPPLFQASFQTPSMRQGGKPFFGLFFFPCYLCGGFFFFFFFCGCSFFLHTGLGIYRGQTQCFLFCDLSPTPILLIRQGSSVWTSGSALAGRTMPAGSLIPLSWVSRPPPPNS